MNKLIKRINELNRRIKNFGHLWPVHFLIFEQNRLKRLEAMANG